jgi:hypothetical protein
MSGYANTVSEEHPALETGLNDAPIRVNFPSGITGDLMNRTDNALWSDLARTGTGYNASYPREFSPDELTPSVLQLWWIGTKNKIFTISELNEYIYYNNVPSWDGDELYTYPETFETQQGVLVYGTTKIEAEAVKIAKYTKRQIGED